MTEARWLTAKQERAWRRYRRMRTLLDLAISRDLRQDSKLSDADYDVLSTLSEADDGRWRSGDLAARLLWSTSRLSHQVGRMETRGLISRTAVEHDARGAVIALTGAGRRALTKAAPLHVASVRANFIGLLTADEIATLDRIAARVIQRLES